MSEVTVSRGSTTRPLGSISDGTDKAPGPIDRMAVVAGRRADA